LLEKVKDNGCFAKICRQGKTVPIHEKESDSVVSFWCLVLCTCVFTCQTKNSRQLWNQILSSTQQVLVCIIRLVFFTLKQNWNSPHHPWLHRLSIQQSKIESLLQVLDLNFSKCLRFRWHYSTTRRCGYG